MKSDFERGLSGSEFQAVIIIFQSVGQMLGTDSTNDEFCIIFKVCCRRHYLPYLSTEAGTRGAPSCSLYLDDSFQAGVRPTSVPRFVYVAPFSHDPACLWSPVTGQVSG